MLNTNVIDVVNKAIYFIIKNEVNNTKQAIFFKLKKRNNYCQANDKNISSTIIIQTFEFKHLNSYFRKTLNSYIRIWALNQKCANTVDIRKDCTNDITAFDISAPIFEMFLLVPWISQRFVILRRSRYFFLICVVDVDCCTY